MRIKYKAEALVGATQDMKQVQEQLTTVPVVVQSRADIQYNEQEDIVTVSVEDLQITIQPDKKHHLSNKLRVEYESDDVHHKAYATISNVNGIVGRIIGRHQTNLLE